MRCQHSRATAMIALACYFACLCWSICIEITSIVCGIGAARILFYVVVERGRGSSTIANVVWSVMLPVRMSFCTLFLALEASTLNILHWSLSTQSFFFSLRWSFTAASIFGSATSGTFQQLTPKGWFIGVELWVYPFRLQHHYWTSTIVFP